MTFAPFLAFLLTKHEFSKALWLSAFAGLTIDLYTTALPLGAHTLLYTLTVSLLYFYRHLFFFDKKGALALLTALVSMTATLLEIFLFSFFNEEVRIGPLGLVTNVVVMPLVDALYALLFFWLPMEAYNFGKRIWPKIYLLLMDRKSKA